MEKKRDYCNNCGNFGHTYSNCRHPILSYGVILFKPMLNKDEVLSDWLFLFNADIIRHSIIESEEIFIVSR